jgi:hypothetical protein
VSTAPSDPITADRSTGDTAALVPTATGATQPADPITADPVTADPVTADPVTADPVTADPVTADPVTADPVTAREIAEFLHHLARFRSPAAGGDPADHAALLARKAELFTRIADQHAGSATSPPPTKTPTPTPPPPEGRTP